QPTQGTGEESRASAGKPSRGSGDPLSQSLSGIPRMEGGFYSAERGKGRCPFPRAPIPETKIVHSRCRSSMEKKSLSTHENADLFLGMGKLQPEDISIVAKMGTFLRLLQPRSEVRMEKIITCTKCRKTFTV